MESIKETDLNLQREKVTSVANTWLVKAVNPTTGEEKMIDVSNFSSVVAEQFMFGALKNSADVDSLTGFGFYSAGGITGTSLPTGYGMLMCFQTKGWYDRIQIFLPTDTSTSVFFRIATQNGSFGAWRKIAFTV